MAEGRANQNEEFNLANQRTDHFDLRRDSGSRNTAQKVAGNISVSALSRTLLRIWSKLVEASGVTRLISE